MSGKSTTGMMAALQDDAARQKAAARAAEVRVAPPLVNLDSNVPNGVASAFPEKSPRGHRRSGSDASSARPASAHFANRSGNAGLTVVIEEEDVAVAAEIPTHDGSGSSSRGVTTPVSPGRRA